MNNMNKEMPIKVVIIDDNKRIRFIIHETLRTETDIEICGEVGTAREAEELLSTQTPDVAVLDISLGDDEGGLEFLRRMSEKGTSTRFVVLSSHTPSRYVEKSYASGAKAYLPKDMTVQYLAEAIRSAYRDERFIPTEV